MVPLGRLPILRLPRGGGKPNVSPSSYGSLLCPYSSRRPFSSSSPSLTLSPGPAFSFLRRPFLSPRPLGKPPTVKSPPYRRFSASPVAMAATKIDGTAIARGIREGLKDEIVKIQQSNPRFKPSLVIFQSVYCPTHTADNENAN